MTRLLIEITKGVTLRFDAKALLSPLGILKRYPQPSSGLLLPPRSPKLKSASVLTAQPPARTRAWEVEPGEARRPAPARVSANGDAEHRVFRPIAAFLLLLRGPAPPLRFPFSST